jgi:hypothetical protein
MVVLTAAHLTFTILCIGKASYLYADKDTILKWQIALKIAGFPIVFLNQLSYRGSVPKLLEFDWLPALILLNSLLWGFILTVVVALVAKRYQQGSH